MIYDQTTKSVLTFGEYFIDLIKRKYFISCIKTSLAKIIGLINTFGRDKASFYIQLDS